MRLVSVVLMAGAAVAVVVVAFLNLPIPYVQLKPLPAMKGVGSMSDIRADSPDPPPPTAEAVARIRKVFVPECRSTVRSESDRRRLGLAGERVAKLCDCRVETMIETHGQYDGREGFSDFSVVAGRDRGADRRQLDDAQYLAMVTAAERACAAR